MRAVPAAISPALGEIEPELLKLGFQILALSPEGAAGLKAAAEKNHLNYRLLSDQVMQAASAFGLAFRVEAKTVTAYTGHGITLAAVPGEPAARWLPGAGSLPDRSRRPR